MHDFPYEVVPEGQILCADMSSNFCTTEINWEKYGFVYAGAQKNVGPAGVCMGFVRKDLLGRHMRKDTPMLLDWKTFANAPQTFQNTPCCWSIYMCGLNLAYMRDIGIAELNKRAKERSSKLYDYIDSSNYYKNGIEK